MLVFNAKAIVSVTPVEAKAYDFTGDDGKRMSGTSIKSTITAIGDDDRVAVITVKAKTKEEAQTKLDSLKLKVGAPARIPITPQVVGGVAQLKF